MRRISVFGVLDKPGTHRLPQHPVRVDQASDGGIGNGACAAQVGGLVVVVVVCTVRALSEGAVQTRCSGKRARVEEAYFGAIVDHGKFQEGSDRHPWGEISNVSE